MSHTTQTIVHKVGATFAYSGTIELPAGTWDAACQAYDGSTLVQEFTVTLTPPVNPATAHSITIRAEASATNLWAADKYLRCDIVFFDSSPTPVKVPTQTFTIKTIAKVTDA